mgnify:CR=1 FL=1
MACTLEYATVVYPLDRAHRILLPRRCNTRFANGQRNGPGGRLAEGETPWECAVRETDEEIGVELDPRALTYTARLFDAELDEDDTAHPRFVVDYFIATAWSGVPAGTEKIPYMLAYDCLLTYINWFVKNRL